MRTNGKFYLILICIFPIILSCATVQQKDITYAEQEGIPIIVSKMSSSLPNSAGGVNVSINAMNVSHKTIKYITYEVVFRNSVSDIVRCTLRRESTFRILYTGPLEHRKSSVGNWSNIIYNNSVRSIEIISAHIEYMDNTSITIKTEDVPFIDMEIISRQKRNETLGYTLGIPGALLGGGLLGFLIILPFL